MKTEFGNSELSTMVDSTVTSECGIQAASDTVSVCLFLCVCVCVSACANAGVCGMRLITLYDINLFHAAD